MSSLTMPSAVTPTLPALNIHPHGHGHKKGSPLDPTSDSSSSTAAPIPVGSAQNLFGSLFSSLQQIIGTQPVPAATNPAASTGNAASASAAVGSAAAAAPKINVMA
ncbi:MAG TPA: hypothetical protein VK743_07765 [Steroidobacteraceae bacterium]|jgi:hypothetical protein|nr:hypothetical protein [Steroidobacteraceae bacterium]